MGKGEKVYANTLGIPDEALKQIRVNCYNIGNGTMTGPHLKQPPKNDIMYEYISF